MNKKLVPAVALISWDRILREDEITSYKRSLHKYPKKEIVKCIVSFMNNNIMTTEDRKIFNKILGDHKILNKLQICTDGSYANGRIFYKKFYGFNECNIFVDGEFWMQKYRKNNKSYNIVTKLNYMQNNFEVIYLHLVSDEWSAMDKDWDDMMDTMIDNDDYEDYDNSFVNEDIQEGYMI